MCKKKKKERKGSEKPSRTASREFCLLWTQNRYSWVSGIAPGSNSDWVAARYRCSTLSSLLNYGRSTVGKVWDSAFGIKTFRHTWISPRTMNLHNLPSLWRQPLLLPSSLPMLKAFQCMHLGQELHPDATPLKSPRPPPLIACKPIMRVRDQERPLENTGLFCALY